MKKQSEQQAWTPPSSHKVGDRTGDSSARLSKPRFFPGFVPSLTKPTKKKATPQFAAQARRATDFQSDFSGCMDLYASPDIVAAYLDRHQDWFIRCAAPMQVEPVEADGYVLTIGRYGSFGYELEPKIGVRLLPQQAGIYRLETINLPEAHPDYQIDFQAEMQLVNPGNEPSLMTTAGTDKLSTPVTHVKWTLNLGVRVFFPAFIHRLPMALIERTGTQLLNQVVRRISRSLTTKVRNDFHQSQGISIKK